MNAQLFSPAGYAASIPGASLEHSSSNNAAIIQRWLSRRPRGLRRRPAASCLLGFGFESTLRDRKLLRVVRLWSLRQADPSSKGVLPSVVCLSIIVKPR